MLTEQVTMQTTVILHYNRIKSMHKYSYVAHRKIKSDQPTRFLHYLETQEQTTTIIDSQALIV